ncbi:carbon monoxide dehydrogenase [Rummeliibacillus sp. JY-2-4R]
MLKEMCYMLVFSFMLLFFSATGGVLANSNSDIPPPSFEDKFAEGGYTSVGESVKEFENHMKCEVSLPEVIPSISFTHKFGRFDDGTEYNRYNELQIRFVHKDVSENIFKMDIRPIKDKLNFEGKEYTLSDGSKGIYFEDYQFNFFVFEKNNLQYLLGIHKKLSNTVTPDIFVRIANSVK